MTFNSLKRQLPTFQNLASANITKIANAITLGGLSNQKAQTIIEVIESNKKTSREGMS